MEIIGTTKISYEIEQLLDNAENHLILVSPYLKLTQRLKVRLSNATKKLNSIFILYRANELKADEKKWLQTLQNIHLYSIKNLHAKIYLNEQTILISSMNLYEYSQINNHEIGVKIEKSKDNKAYKTTLQELKIIFESEYSNEKFSSIIEDYSMNSLFRELTKKYSFKNYDKHSHSLYEYISQKSIKIVNFEKHELYQDGSAVLRRTDLGKKRFEILITKLKEFSNEC